MRLENKMNKWFKFILKMFPFYFLIFNLFNVLFNESLQFDISLILSNSISSSNNYFLSCIYRLFANDRIDFIRFNQDFFRIITGFHYTNNDFANAWSIFNFSCCVFEWFILIDIFDLLFSAFRFIIDICRSWLDSFYDKNKGGYK